MEELYIETEIRKGIKTFDKGETLISFRRKLIDSGIDNASATHIARESFRRSLIQSGKAKLIRGSLWFICGILVTLLVFFLSGKIYYILSFATLWGFIQIFKGYSIVKSAKYLEDKV